VKSEEAALPVELSDEPLVGWRCWFVLPEELLLRPIYKRGLAWKPRQALEAVCPEHLHEPPAEGCKCGVWTVCHPMLLDEIGWTSQPPQGVDQMPGVLVVGEVSLWGKILQHERGWRASCAYPRHLYAFTDDPMIAETLRERYGVPVEWGPDAERLRRMLPPPDEEKDAAPAPTVDAALLGVVDAGLMPAALRELFVEALKADADWFKRDPRERLRIARAWLAGAARNERRQARWDCASAAAEVAAVAGDTLAAGRRAWVHLLCWQRNRAAGLWKEIERNLRGRDETIEDLARGTRQDGKPYAPGTLKEKRGILLRYEQAIAKNAEKVAGMTAVEIPTYRGWRRMLGGGLTAVQSAGGHAPTAEDLEPVHQALMRREQRLTEHERALAIERHRLALEREALESQQRDHAEQLRQAHAALAEERARLRDDVVAGVERDHAGLLEAVGELEHRRRAALAMLPGPWPPVEHGGRPHGRSTQPRPDENSRLADERRRQMEALRRQLAAVGISLTHVASAASVGLSNVSAVFAGRTVSANVVTTAEWLLAKAMKRRARKEGAR
jgi:hypothetical protein